LIVIAARVDRLSGIHVLATVDILNLRVVVRLHEVRDATTSSRVQHLLAVLAVLGHHVVMLLLLLLELVVESMELGGLTTTRGEHRVDVLAEGDLWAEPVHLVVKATSCWHPHRSRFLLLLAARWELVEVWRLLNHALIISLNIVLADRVSLELVESAGDRFDLDRQFEYWVGHHFVAVALRSW
jgi:hypothetical protein